MKSNNERSSRENKQEKTESKATAQDFERLANEAEKNEKRKPGSQSNSSKQHNNGRGGGK